MTDWDALGACGLVVIGVAEVYPVHLEGFVFSKVSLLRTGSLRETIVN